MKAGVKVVADFIAHMLVVPAWLMYKFGAVVLGTQQAFAGWSQAFALLPGVTGAYLRRAFYRRALANCGDGGCIMFGTVISHPTACIGRRVYIGAFCALGDVTLADDVLLGSHVSIINGSAQHGIDRLDVPVREQLGMFPRVTIGEDTWVGERALVMADVGRHAVVAAGAVVTRPVPDFAIVAGVPAKIIGNRRESRLAISPASDGEPRPTRHCLQARRAAR